MVTQLLEMLLLNGHNEHNEIDNSSVCIHIRLLFALSVVVNKTSQELRMLSSVTFNWKVTMNDRTVVRGQRYIGQELLKVNILALFRLSTKLSISKSGI